jgi:hypothetical protein
MSYDATRRGLDALTDDVGFERLATILLARTGINVRPLGGPGDRGRDAVAGLYRAEGGEPLAVTISLEKDWRGKIRADLKRIHNHGFRPETVIAVTNKPAGPQEQVGLQQRVRKEWGVDLTICERRWLVTQLHRRDNLDLLGEYLHLPPPRPRFFLDLGEFERLLKERGLLAAPFAGRREEFDELERLLGEERRSVIIEAHGGFGKTRLAVELARSGRSATPWFFVPYGLPFEADHLAETEAGYDVTVVIDDAHRRTDLDQLLHALERRDPKPRLVCIVRPGHATHVETALHGLALLQPTVFPLSWLGRSALDAILRSPPFAIEREGMRSWIIAVSEGNVGVALIAGELAAAGRDPRDLSQAELFAAHVELRLHGGGADSRESRELLALVAGVGSLRLGDVDDAAAATAILGGDRPQLRRQLDELADAGVVEEADLIYTIKPDIVRERLLRASFFPEAGERPLLRYQDVYAAFAPRRLHVLLEALGQARIDTTPAAAEALATVQRDLIALLERATTAAELENVMHAARALGAGGGAIVRELIAAVLDRLDRLDDGAADQVAVRLVEALAAAKLGRDQLPPTWRLLLRLATVACCRTGTPRACEAALTEIRGIYGSAPINYSAGDVYVLAHIQRTVREQSEAWWADARGQPGAARVAAAVVRTAFTLQLEAHRPAAADAMAISLVAGFAPANAATEAVLRLGLALFRDSFLDLRPDEQLKTLEAVDALARVAEGYPGSFGAQPTKDLEELARSALGELEQWLANRLEELPLPVAAAVLSHFRLGLRRRGSDTTSPRPKGDLRVYVDLVDNNQRGRARLSWEKELAEVRARGARHGDALVHSADPIAVLQRWNGWIEECEALTARPANHLPLNAALERVAQSAPELATDLATHMIENELAIARFSDRMLDELARERANWPLIQRWAAHPSPNVRSAAARTLNRAPEELARRVTSSLTQDPDIGVRDQLWRALVYGGAPPSGWRLDVALALTEASETPLELLDQLLGVIRHRANGKTRLSAKQRETVKRIVLASAAGDLLPHDHRVQLALEEVERFSLDLVIPWLRARLDYAKSQTGSGHYIHHLPDELRPLLHARRRQADAKREFKRLLDELEAGASGMYRYSLEQAVCWLGIDSGELTRRINQWARAGEDKGSLAFAFLASASWPVFTGRARALLDARPGDPQVREVLSRARNPFSSTGFIGSLEPSYRAHADEYRSWTRSRDPRLRGLGQEAVGLYERLADEEAAKERRERERV